MVRTFAEIFEVQENAGCQDDSSSPDENPIYSCTHKQKIIERNHSVEVSI